MEKRKKYYFGKRIYTFIAYLIVIITMILLFQEVWFETFNGLMDRGFNERGNILIISLYAIVIILMFRAWGGFKIGYQTSANVVLSQFLAIISSNIFLILQVSLLVAKMHEMKNIIKCILILTAEDLFFCLIPTTLFAIGYNKIFKPWKILEIDGHVSNNITNKLETRTDKYQVCEKISVDEPWHVLEEKIKSYDAVLLNELPEAMMNQVLRYCFVHSVRVYFTPRITDIIVKSTGRINLFDTPLYLCKNVGLTYGQMMAKRCMDIVISVLGLVILLPVYVVTALLIKLYDGGPIFYRQERCTLNGQIFTIYKFRSMIVDAEKNGEVIPATENDPRITPIGRVIRRFHIDELPQLVNVLKGEMSIVGPRPERIEHVLDYSKQVPEFYYRLKVKGGITGYAQVYGKYNTSAYDKLKMDLEYIVEYSILLDLQIIMETFKVLFRNDNTEGFKEENDENSANH